MLRHDGANLAAFLRALRERHPQVYDNLVDTVRLVTPSFAAFDLPTDATLAEVRDRPPLRWRERDSGAHFGARALSDGTWRFICLAAALLAPEPPTVIVIDEPELGLHPYAIAVLAGLLRSAATRTQIIVSTQSVTLVNHFRPQDVIVVEARAGRSVFARPDVPALRQWLDEYATGELWEKNLLGGRPG
jgi:predicted ATPase